MRRVPPIIACLAFTACLSPSEAVDEADREVYALIAERRQALEFAPQALTLELDPESVRGQVLRGERDGIEALSLVQAFEIAAESNRDYQDQRESLYLAALDLTLEQWRFGTQPSGVGSLAVDGVGGEATTASAGFGAGIARLLGSGAQLLADAGLSLTRSLATGDAWSLSSDLAVSVTQPLLRGAGRDIVREPLTQAERNLLYAVRSYERFRRTFIRDVVGQYLLLLEQVQGIDNQELNLANLSTLRERNEGLAAAGRLSDIQVDQARQDELRSRSRLIGERSRFETNLDRFKLFLGLPPTTEVELDRSELGSLDQLEQEVSLQILEADAILVALRRRFDYVNTVDRIEDRERRVRIAADSLRAGLGLRVDASAFSEEGKAFKYSSSGVGWTVALDLNLPWDQLPERNGLRASGIALEAAIRSAEELAEVIAADLRQSLREVETTAEEFMIQAGAGELAERRVESAELNLQAGRANTRDLLEAEEALLDARNALVASRIDNLLARLDLVVALESLDLGVEGLIVDRDGIEEALTQGTEVQL